MIESLACLIAPHRLLDCLRHQADSMIEPLARRPRLGIWTWRRWTLPRRASLRCCSRRGGRWSAVMSSSQGRRRGRVRMRRSWRIITSSRARLRSRAPCCSKTSVTRCRCHRPGRRWRPVRRGTADRIGSQLSAASRPIPGTKAPVRHAPTDCLTHQGTHCLPHQVPRRRLVTHQSPHARGAPRRDPQARGRGPVRRSRSNLQSTSELKAR